MKKFWIAVVLVVAGYAISDHVSQRAPVVETHEVTAAPRIATLPADEPRPSTPAPASQPFQCDGRTRCPQMTSCAEARYFLVHCPNTRMDGDNDGVPCEDQWCP